MDNLCLFFIIFKSIYIAVATILSIISYRISIRAHRGTERIWFLLRALILCDLLAESAWITNTLYKAGSFAEYPYLIMAVIAYRRIGWIATCLEYLIMSLFLEAFVKEIPHKTLYRICTWAPPIFPIASMLFITLFNATLTSTAERNFEYGIVYGYTHYYILGTLIFLLCYACYTYYKANLPRIVREQLMSFALYFLLPHLACILIVTNYHTITQLRAIAIEKYYWLICSDIIFACTCIYTMRRLLHLRLFGIYEYIQRHKISSFAHELQNFLFQASKSSSINELKAIVKQRFSQSYAIHQDTINLYNRPARYIIADIQEYQHIATSSHIITEQILRAPHHRSLTAEIIKRTVLIRDEIEFDYFYEKQTVQKELITFMKQINADIFIPMYDQTQIIGYIIINHNARASQLFSGIERDEMVSYANYLSAIINLLQNRSIKELLIQDTDAQDELYTKQQEIKHYKESIRTLIQQHTKSAIGIGHYYKRTIEWLSSSFLQLLEANTEQYEQLHQYQSLIELCHQTARYHEERSITITTGSGKQVQCHALMRPGEKQRVILVAQPIDTTDTLLLPFTKLEDIATWEYALYLETTESGRLINQLIPGNTAELLNSKIELLKASMSRKAVLLETAADDLNTIVTILHHISMRARLHTVSLDHTEKDHEYSLMLYGMDAAISTEHSRPLLIQLHTIGTLFIRNVERLSITAQERLAEFITTGMFKPLMSDRQIRSNVRILCSTHQNLADLVDAKQFSQALFDALQPSIITIPSILSMDRQNLEHMAHALSSQTVQTTEFKDIMSLTRKDIDQIVYQRPTSLNEFKQKVQDILTSKSEKQGISSLISFNNEEPLSDTPPEVLNIIRMGKRALHNKKTLLILWDHFQSQAKIAQVLKVNRSSVHRRCKAFAIDTTSTPTAT